MRPKQTRKQSTKATAPRAPKARTIAVKVTPGEHAALTKRAAYNLRSVTKEAHWLLQQAMKEAAS